MINKILIAEDIDSINTGIISILNEKYNIEIEHANSCDTAYLKILKAIQDQKPFDLLISDLSFKTEEFLPPTLKNGEELVKSAKSAQQNLKTIVYTIEDRPSLIKRLKDQINVNSIVLKGLNSLQELCTAIDEIAKDNNYFTQEVLRIIKNDSTNTIEEYDVNLLELLSKGYTQQEICVQFKEQAVKPFSLSSVEKRIGELKNILKANNGAHLVSIAKDMCII